VSHFESDSERLVEEFFAEHRRRIDELSADEVTWARIRDRHRSGRRQPRPDHAGDPGPDRGRDRDR
jgi:hypothetical protein